MKHKHHIIPKHMGGTDDPSNLVQLTIAEHAEAHRRLYEKHGLLQDKLAWLGLSKLIDTAEILHTLQSEGMKGPLNPMYGKAAPNRGIKRPGIGGRKKGTKWSEEERAKKMQLRNSPDYKEKMKKIYADPMRNQKIGQASKGKVGPSLGKRWYNDGLNESLYDNAPDGWKPGRLNKGKIGPRYKKWYHNGTKECLFNETEVPNGWFQGRLNPKSGK